jgi:hypothetical protein
MTSDNTDPTWRKPGQHLQSRQFQREPTTYAQLTCCRFAVNLAPSLRTVSTQPRDCDVANAVCGGSFPVDERNTAGQRPTAADPEL